MVTACLSLLSLMLMPFRRFGTWYRVTAGLPLRDWRLIRLPCVAVAIWTPILPLGSARMIWLEESSLTYESESACSPWSPWIMISFDIKPLDMVMSGSVSPGLWTAMMFRVSPLNKVIAGCPLLSSIVRLLHSLVDVIKSLVERGIADFRLLVEVFCRRFQTG